MPVWAPFYIDYKGLKKVRQSASERSMIDGASGTQAYATTSIRSSTLLLKAVLLMLHFWLLASALRSTPPTRMEIRQAPYQILYPSWKTLRYHSVTAIRPKYMQQLRMQLPIHPNRLSCPTMAKAPSCRRTVQPSSSSLSESSRRCVAGNTILTSVR